MALAETGRAYRQKFLGQIWPVLWEGSHERNAQGWRIEGLTGNYLRVSTTAPEPRWNQLDPVRLTGLTEDGLSGEIVS
jgi:hypothetical protein